MAGLNLESGYMKVMDKASVPDGRTPFASDTRENGAGGRDIHTHTMEGRSYNAVYQNSIRPGSVAIGKAAFGDVNDGDFGRRSYEEPGKEKYRQGIFDVVVTPTHVYLYRDGQVTISVARDNVPSKKPDDIK